MDSIKKSTDYLFFLIKNHDSLHHTIKGEVSFSAMDSILAPRDKDLFDRVPHHNIYHVERHQRRSHAGRSGPVVFQNKYRMSSHH